LGGFRVDAAEVAVLLEQPEGGFEVGGRGEAAAGGGSVGISTAELGAVGPGDPVQEPAGVVDSGVGAHEVEDGASVLDEVVGQPEGAGEGVGADRVGPAVAEVAGQASADPQWPRSSHQRFALTFEWLVKCSPGLGAYRVRRTAAQ
jgi:hypothetical protein